MDNATLIIQVPGPDGHVEIRFQVSQQMLATPEALGLFVSKRVKDALKAYDITLPEPA